MEIAQKQHLFDADYESPVIFLYFSTLFVVFSAPIFDALNSALYLLEPF